MIFKSSDGKYDFGVYPQPIDEIDPAKKNGAWIAEHAKYYYSQYIAGNCGITPTDVKALQLNRSYLSGCQPTDQYKSILTFEASKGSKQDLLTKRKAYHNINYDSLSSPMPKYAKKIEGMFLKQDHKVSATAVNEKSRADKETLAIEKKIALQLSETRQKLEMMMNAAGMGVGQDTPKSFLERDIEEIQMLANAGTYKLGYEVAAEMAIDTTMKMSNHKHIKRKVVRDLLCSNIGAMREEIVEDHVKIRYVDPATMIIPHVENSGYDDNVEYFCYQRIYTIKQLRQVEIYDEDGNLARLKEEELKELAKTFHTYNHPDNASGFNLYSKYYDSDHSYGYDDYKIPVIYTAFLSVDTKYNYKFNVVGEERISEGKWGITKKNTSITSTQTIYHGNWIIGTKYHFNCGKLNDIPLNSTGKARLPVHVVKLDGTSVMDNAKPILDDYALLGFRLQNAWAKAVPSGYGYDWSILEEAAKASAGKLTEFDIMRMHEHTGRYIYRSRPQDSNYNVPMGEPIKRYEGGVGWTVLQEFMTQEQSLDKKLVDVTGIPPVETAGERTSPNVMRMAIASMSDVLKPYYDAYIEIKENAAYNAVYRIQIMVRHSKTAKTFYTEQMGKGYVAFLEEAFDKEPMAFGISFEAMANDEVKQRFLDAAQMALAPGKNGVPLLRLSDYAYLVENINTNSGIKQFRLLLQHREIMDEQLAQQRQKQMMESQGQEVQKQIALKQGLSVAETMGKGGLELEKIKVSKDLDARNKGLEQGNQAVVDMITNAVIQAMSPYLAAMGQEQQGQQMGQDGQLQPPQVPQPMTQQQ